MSSRKSCYNRSFPCGLRAVQSLMNACNTCHQKRAAFCGSQCPPVGRQGEETAPHHNQHDQGTVQQQVGGGRAIIGPGIEAVLRKCLQHAQYRMSERGRLQKDFVTASRQEAGCNEGRQCSDCEVPPGHVGAPAPPRVRLTAVGTHPPLLQQRNSTGADHQAELLLLQPQSMWRLAAPRNSTAVRLHCSLVSALPDMPLRSF